MGSFRVHPDGSIEVPTLAEAVVLSRSLRGIEEALAPVVDQLAKGDEWVRRIVGETRASTGDCRLCGQRPRSIEWGDGVCLVCHNEAAEQHGAQGALVQETELMERLAEAERRLHAKEPEPPQVEVKPDEKAGVGTPAWWEDFYRKNQRDPTPAELTAAFKGRETPLQRSAFACTACGCAVTMPGICSTCFSNQGVPPPPMFIYPAEPVTSASSPQALRPEPPKDTP